MQSSTLSPELTLSPAARRQGLLVLLTNNLLMWTGFIMVIPLLAVHYVDNLGWPAASIGLILAVRQFTQQGLGVFGGILSDRIGVKGLLIAGLLLRAVGFGMMAWAINFPILLASAIFAALGGALFEAPSRSAVVLLSLPEERSRYFTIQSTISSVGTAAGPLLGTLLMTQYNFELVAITAASLYIVSGIAIYLWLPITGNVAPQPDQKIFGGLQAAFQDRIFMTFTILGGGLWFLWVQFSVAVPLQATATTGTAEAVSWLYTINAVLSISLQYVLVRLLSRWINAVQLLGLGMILMASGLGAIAFAHNTLQLLACVVIYVLGSLLAMPSQQTASAELAKPAALGAYFGVGALSLALGGGIGNLVGGYLYDLGIERNLPQLPWLTFWVVGVITGVGLLILQRYRARADQAAEKSTEAEISAA